MWRLLIGLGCVPGVLALYFRLTIPETPRFTMDVERNIDHARQNIRAVLHGEVAKDGAGFHRRIDIPTASPRDFIGYFKQWKNFRILFGTAYSWLAVDVAFYGLGLNSSAILQAINSNNSAVTSASITDPRAAYKSLEDICQANMILAVAGLIPGYWMSFMFIDSWGRKPIQLMGFFVTAILFAIMGFAYSALVKSGKTSPQFVALYGLAYFFLNFGPNTTTFIIPGEVYPTRYRSTGHGISAASGKIGSVIAQIIIGLRSEPHDLRSALDRLQPHGESEDIKAFKLAIKIFALIMLTGALATLLLPETKGRTLEDLSNEEQDGFVQGAGHDLQYDTDV